MAAIAYEKEPQIDELLREKQEGLECLSQEYDRLSAENAALLRTNVEIQEQIELAQREASALKQTLEELTASIDSQVKQLVEKAHEKLEVYRGLGLVPEDLGRLLCRQARDSELPQRTLADDLGSDWRQLVSNIHGWLFTSCGLVYERSTIETLIAALRTHDLIVFAGLPGSGKTHLILNVAEAIGAEYRIIPVKPNWTSSEDLLGYYHPLDGRYNSTEFLDALIHASRNPERLFLVCLDEMNLARVEYYFADFLSLLEDRKTLPELRLYPSSVRARLEREDGAKDVDLFCVPWSLRILPNVRFIGTVNIDETTHGLSPKVLDRAFVMRFENPLRLSSEKIRAQIGDYSAPGDRVLVTPDDMPKRTEYPRVAGEEDENHPCAVLQAWARDYLLDLGADIGFRTLRQAHHYHQQLCEIVPAEEVDRRFLDDVLRMKILPRLTFDGKLKVTSNGRQQSVREKKLIFDEFLMKVSDQLGECASVRDMRAMRQAAECRDDEFNYWV